MEGRGGGGGVVRKAESSPGSIKDNTETVTPALPPRCSQAIIELRRHPRRALETLTRDGPEETRPSPDGEGRWGWGRGLAEESF